MYRNPLIIDGCKLGSTRVSCRYSHQSIRWTYGQSLVNIWPLSASHMACIKDVVGIWVTYATVLEVKQVNLCQYMVNIWLILLIRLYNLLHYGTSMPKLNSWSGKAGITKPTMMRMTLPMTPWFQEHKGHNTLKNMCGKHQHKERNQTHNRNARSKWRLELASTVALTLLQCRTPNGKFLGHWQAPGVIRKIHRNAGPHTVKPTKSWRLWVWDSILELKVNALLGKPNGFLGKTTGCWMNLINSSNSTTMNKYSLQPLATDC